MRTISFSAARANLKAVMDRVVEDRAPVAIIRQTAEGVVMVSASEWEAIEETLHLLRAPGNAARLTESIAELDSGSASDGQQQ
ncbi:MAG: type II toxin-antitoxin system prevent-host-death family antitoxin [Sphingomonas sp.]|jgi:antitoxin YefM|uniref:type II toxin-antitoxin system Phd/YefM family antitoxin n=1 Tax=Sphingomonas sp. TaxID=28214 RepID=UPI003563DEBD